MSNQKSELESEPKKESDISDQKSTPSLSNNQEIHPAEQSISNNETLDLAKEAIKSLSKEALDSLKGFSNNKENENSTSPQEIPNKEASNNKSNEHNR